MCTSVVRVISRGADDGLLPFAIAASAYFARYRSLARYGGAQLELGLWIYRKALGRGAWDIRFNGRQLHFANEKGNGVSGAVRPCGRLGRAFDGCWAQEAPLRRTRSHRTYSKSLLDARRKPKSAKRLSGARLLRAAQRLYLMS